MVRNTFEMARRIPILWHPPRVVRGGKHSTEYKRSYRVEMVDHMIDYEHEHPLFIEYVGGSNGVKQESM